MKTKLIFLILMSAFCFTPLLAQKGAKKILITGTVVDASQNPISNAIIMIDNQKTSVVTDAKGMYKIKVKPDASTIGIFTFGNGLKEEQIGGRTLIDFKFGQGKSDVAPDQKIPASETSVNMGYSSTKKKNLTNEAYSIDPNIKKRTYSSIYEMLQEVPGVHVSGSQVVVQDSKNLWGYVPPLFVVDGVYTDDPGIVSPTQVESITVLKGSSAAMYGSRGYGGVILIKRKKIEINKK